jgi:hypothetical protein
MSFYATRPTLDSVAVRNPIFGDVREFGEQSELLEILWWLSDNEENAGQQMVAQGRQGLVPDGSPVTLRYRRLCPLWHLRREEGEGQEPPPASSGPPVDPFDRSMDAGPPPEDSPFVYSGARIMINGTYFSPLDKTAEEIVISRIARPPDGSPAVGNAADLLRACCTYDSEPAPASPFDQPNGKTILFAVTHATGRWSHATNVIVRIGPAGFTVPPREVIIVRGARAAHHGGAVFYNAPPAPAPAPPTI